MTRQMVCEGQCNRHTVRDLSDRLGKSFLATHTLVEVNGKQRPSVLLDPALVRASRAWVHTCHEPAGIGEWRCLECGSERR